MDVMRTRNENQTNKRNENAMTTETNRRLQAGTMVVSTEDAEPGRIVRVATYRRNGLDAWSYVVETAHGREVWDAGECFVVAQQG